MKNIFTAQCKGQNIGKSSFLFLIMLSLQLSTALWGQGLSTWQGSQKTTRGIEITPFYGWMFGGSLSVREGDLNIKDNDNFGIAVDIELPYGGGKQLELLWVMQNSRLDLKRYPSGITETLFDIVTHYFHIGGVYGVRQGNVMPFGSLTLGATLFHPKEEDVSDEWRFSATFGLGAKIYVSERVGLRLQGRLMMPFQWGGGGLWCGTGGCSAGVGTSTTILQGDLTGGLIILL
jgi:hypothetical protein